jgi:aldehyde:ferredoxin oxidoreductase
MELREKNIIDKKFTDDVDLVFVNGDAMVELMPKMVFKKGCGKKLVLGPYRLAQTLGEKAMESVYHQKGMCATGVETRSTIGSMLQFAVSPRGSHHLSGLPTAEWVNVPALGLHVTGHKEAGDIRSYHPEGKAKLVQYYENLFFMSDSLGICKFNFGHLGYFHDKPEHLEYMYDMVLQGIYYASGIKYSKEELFAIFEKSNQIERATITMRGIRRKDDQPNHKCLTQSCPGDHPVGPVPLPPIDSKKYNKILDAYYKVRGWDKKTGIPKQDHLKKLGLGDVAKKLKKAVA